MLCDKCHKLPSKDGYKGTELGTSQSDKYERTHVMGRTGEPRVTVHETDRNVLGMRQMRLRIFNPEGRDLHLGLGDSFLIRKRNE